jgi:hypothetical protein
VTTTDQQGNNHESAGAPSGGRFAAKANAEPVDVNLAAPAFPDDYQGDCDGCGARVGYTEDNEVVHLRKDGVADYDPTDHAPSFNPDTYVGGAVDEIAEASGWGSTKLERYEDSQTERRESAAYNVAFERGRAAASAEARSGTAAGVRDRAQALIPDAERLYQVASAKAAAQDILAAYPTATTLTLEMSDQEGSAFYPSSILDVAGNELADFEEFENEHYGPLSDLPETPQGGYTAGRAGTAPVFVPDEQLAFMTWQGDRRMGYTAKIDLKLAAAADLSTLGGAR